MNEMKTQQPRNDDFIVKMTESELADTIESVKACKVLIDDFITEFFANDEKTLDGQAVIQYQFDKYRTCADMMVNSVNKLLKVVKGVDERTFKEETEEKPMPIKVVCEGITDLSPKKPTEDDYIRLAQLADGVNALIKTMSEAYFDMGRLDSEYSRNIFIEQYPTVQRLIVGLELQTEQLRDLAEKFYCDCGWNAERELEQAKKDTVREIAKGFSAIINSYKV